MLQAFAPQLTEGGAEDLLLERWRWLPETTLCDETATRLDDRCLVRRRSDHDTTRNKVCQRDVLTQECAPLQAPAGIESDDLVDETSDCAGRSVTNLHDRPDHAHALPFETRQGMVFRIIEHSRELRAREPEQGVV
jgi:hypothetical protein